MKKLILLSTFTAITIATQAQDFLGLSTGNYAGISGVALQPASIADSRYKFDFNITSLSVGFKSNFLSFNREFAVKNRFSFDNYNSYADLKNNVIKFKGTPTNNANYADITNTVQLPVSFMLATGKKSAIALNMRSRTALTVNNISYDFAKFAYDGFPFDTLGIPRTVNANGLNMRGVSWLDAGLTYARVLVDANKHFLKAGITGKYLGGLSSIYFNADKLSATTYNDSNNTVNFNSGGSTVNYAHSATAFNVKPENYRPDANNFGFDAGIVYEFRGRIAKFKVGKITEEGEVVTKVRRDKNKYSFKVGASLVDAGMLNFTSAQDAKDFSINRNIRLKTSGIRNVETFDSVIRNNVNYVASATREYSIALPTALSAQFDLHILKGLYVNAMLYKPFNALNKSATFRTFTPEYYAVTPRFETRFLGVYVPFVLNKGGTRNDITAGTTLRIGPAFVGTNNLSTLFKKTEISEADIHAGLKLPIGFGKPSKAFERFNKLRTDINNKTTTTNTDVENNYYNNTNTKTIEKEVIVTNPETGKSDTVYVMEPVSKKQQVIEKEIKIMQNNPAPQQPIKIIINNYNSPTGTNTEIETEGNDNIELQIEKLRKQIEQKEKMLKELLKDNGTGCIEKKKIIASLKQANNTELNLESANTLNGTSAFFTEKELLVQLQNLQNRNKIANADVTNAIENINKQLNNTRVGSEEEYCLLFAKNELLDLHGGNKMARVQKTVKAKTPESTYQQPTNTYIKNEYNQPVVDNSQELNTLRDEITKLRSDVTKYQDVAQKQGVTIIRDTVIVEKPVIQYVDKVVEKIVEKPVITYVDKIVEKPSIQYVDKVIEKTNTITKVEQLLSLPPDVILFDIGKSLIKPQYNSRLTYYATQLKKFPELNATLTGHTDASGNAAANKILSEKRATAVKNFLTQRGVAATQIQTAFDGADAPTTDNASVAGKSQNRRVEIQFNK